MKYKWIDDLDYEWIFDDQECRIYMVEAEDFPGNGYGAYSLQQAQIQLVEGGYMTREGIDNYTVEEE